MYGIDPGRGNAYVEFDVAPDRLEREFNRRQRIFEHSIVGDIDLQNAAATGTLNR